MKFLGSHFCEFTLSQKVGIKNSKTLEKGWRLGTGSVMPFAAIGVYLVVNLLVLSLKGKTKPLGHRKQGKDLLNS